MTKKIVYSLEERLKMSKGKPQRRTRVPLFIHGSETTLLSANEKMGKSTVLSHMLNQASIGGDFLDTPLPVMDSLYMQLEEPEDLRNSRFSMQGADATKILIPETRYLPTNETWTEFLADIYKQHPFQILAIDSLIALGTHVGILNENDNSAFQKLIFNPLRRFYERYPDVGTLLTHHSKKDTESVNYRGASAIGAGADNILLMKPVKGEPRQRKFAVKNRVGNRGFTIQLEGECQEPFEDEYDVSYALVAGTLPIPDQIISVLSKADGALSKRQLNSAVKGRDQTIQKVLEDFEQKGKVTVERGGNGKANQYSLASGDREPLPNSLPSVGDYGIGREVDAELEMI